MNIIDYVKKNKFTFAQSPINEVDSLVFAELAYMSFSRAQSRAPQKTLGELTQDATALLKGTLSLLRRRNLSLLKAIRRSPRFAPVKVGYFSCRSSDEKDERFAAATFMLDEGVYHVSYRGTGVSLVGWRENLKMALLSVIPTQRLALKYLCNVASRVQGSITVGGLSKGGNLSVYAATYAPQDVKSRIKAVFDHDGPGFNLNIFADEQYAEIKERVYKTVPHDSVVGMLLISDEKYEVVSSTAISIAQHDPFSWVVKDMDGFKKRSGTTHASRATKAAVTEWLNSMDERARRKFVYAVFTIVEGSGAKEVGDFFRRPLHKFHLMRQTYKTLSPSDKRLIAHGGKQLLTLWFKKLFARVPPKEVS